MRDLKSPEAQAMGNDDIKKIITDGKGKMRPVTAVTGTAADNVVAYIRSLKKQAVMQRGSIQPGP